MEELCSLVGRVPSCSARSLKEVSPKGYHQVPLPALKLSNEQITMITVPKKCRIHSELSSL